jgi:hypothetical protein
VTTVDIERSRERVGPGLQASVIVSAYTEERWLQVEMALDSIARQTAAPREVIVDAEYSRATWHHFLDRCYAEGRSKARVARLSRRPTALRSERTYVFQNIRRAIN